MCLCCGVRAVPPSLSGGAFLRTKVRQPVGKCFSQLSQPVPAGQRVPERSSQWFEPTFPSSSPPSLSALPPSLCLSVPSVPSPSLGARRHTNRCQVKLGVDHAGTRLFVMERIAQTQGSDMFPHLPLAPPSPPPATGCLRTGLPLLSFMLLLLGPPPEREHRRLCVVSSAGSPGPGAIVQGKPAHSLPSLCPLAPRLPRGQSHTAGRAPQLLLSSTT